MPLPILRRSRKLTSDVLAERAVKVAVNPRLLDTFPDGERKQLAPVIKAIQAGASGSNSSVRGMQNARALAASTIAQRAHQNLAASVGLTPSDIQLALQQQGLDWVQPFAPGAPLTPFFGYNRRPRNYDYNVGRNVTTETRPDRIPFATLLQLYKSYDVAQICTRHAINDLRSMRIRFEPIDGYEGKNPSKDLAAAKAFWKRPDGVYSFKNWLAKHAMDVWRYDAGTLYKMRDRAGNLKSLKVIQGSTIAPMLDYFGDRPTGEAPAYEQFIEGVPWDWLRAEDLVYEPMWPEPESPYGTPPLETVLVNANTDVRLQMYFLQFFTAGNVPEAFAIAPDDMSDPDGLAELQETWRDWTYGDQSERWGLRWLPAGTEIEPYKPQEFDPDIAEYVMRRTVSAYMMVPNDMGFTADVNKASGSTQVDVQFRIGTSPNVAYYEDIIDSITQEDLGLPVQIRFDTGREKEDRLMEAQAHQIYVSMGAESPSEVREKVLGHPINPEEKVPLFFDSLRLGPVPISYLLAIAGDVDPLTGMPKPGSVEPREFVVPGMMAPDPPVGTPQAGGQHALAPPPPPAPKAAADPKAPARKGDQAEGEDEDELSPTSPHPDEAPGYGTASSGSTGQGSAAKSEDDDLRKWRSNARKAVARGKSPRQFADSAIRPAVYARVWKSLDGATTRADVDAAFAKAAPVPAQWEDFHHHIDTILDHYAPEIQSAMAQVLSDDTIDAVLHEVAKTAKAALPPNQAAAAGVAPPPVNPGTAAAVGVAAGGVTVAAAGAAVATGAVAGAVGGAASVAAVWAILNTAARKFGPLRSVLTALYGDAYIQGAHEGAVTSDGAMPPWTSALDIPSGYWTNWTPGVGESASQMAGGSLATLLADRDIWIKEMTTTQVDRIGTLVAEAIDGGPVDIAELAAEIDQITNDAKRAWLIAETEYSRARTEGARASYALNNVPEIAWISQPGACALCLANQAVSPIERGHPWPSGSVPVHPRCRCVEAPVIHVGGQRIMPGKGRE